MTYANGQTGGANALPEGVLPPLATLMNVDLMVNKDAQVWILHDEYFTDYLKWVEYDAHTRKITIVLQACVMQELGLKIPEKVHTRLLEAKEVSLILVKNKQIQDVYMLPLIVNAW